MATFNFESIENTTAVANGTQNLTADNGVPVELTYIVRGSPGSASSGSGIDANTHIGFRGTNSSDSADPIMDLSFDNAVSSLSFDVVDIDSGSWDEQLRILAFDPDGNPIPITYSLSGSGLTVENDGSGGVLQIDGSSSSDGSIISVSIAGPVGQVQIFYEDGNSRSNDNGVIEVGNFSFTDATVASTADGVVDGEDTGEFMGVGYDDSTGANDGGGDQITDGVDSIEGNGGNDTINGGLGADSIDGGAGDDQITLGAGDAADGGTGDDTFIIDPSNTDEGTITINGENENSADSLIGTDLPKLAWTSGPTDDGAGSFSGQFTFENVEGDTVTVNFSEIENINVTAATGGVVNGAASGEAMGTGFTDSEGDAITSGDDVIEGNAGHDSIDGGGGADSISGGAGNDTISGGEASGPGPELLTNGSFEDGTHSANTVNGLTGWSTTSGSPDSADDGTSAESWNPSLSSSDGTGYVTMWSFQNSPNETIQQTLSTPLESGKTYTLKFDAHSGDYISSTWFTPSNIPVDFEIVDLDTGTVLGSTTVQGTSYQEYSFEFTPVTDVTTIALRPNGTGAGTYPSIALDKVSLFETAPSAGDADTLSGDGGDDTFLLKEGDGNDTITGGETAETSGDTIDASALNSGVTVTGTGDEAGTITDGAATISFDEIENLVLTDQADEANLSAWTSGVGLSGGGGDDTLTGGAGDDTIEGGDGHDTQTGGAGDDVFVFTSGGGDDTITDFGSGNDQVDTSGLDDSGLGIAADGTVTADEVVVTQPGGPGTPQILTFPDGETVQVPAGTVDTSTPADQFASLVAMGVPPCFAPGTLIMTPDGQRKVEDLWPGDLVVTADHGAQPIRWIGRREVDFSDHSDERAQSDKPVQIKAGALGAGVPERDLIVSPQHRMMIGLPEVLSRAKHMTGMPGIRTMQGRKQVTYFALLLDRHEIIFAEGAPTESFRPGPMAISKYSAEHRRQIFRLYPGLLDDPVGALGEPARPIVGRKHVQRMLEAAHRHPPEPV